MSVVSSVVLCLDKEMHIYTAKPLLMHSVVPHVVDSLQSCSNNCLCEAFVLSVFRAHIVYIGDVSMTCIHLLKSIHVVNVCTGI